MTTIVGIQAQQGKKGVILASDLSATRTTWKPQGDIVYREQTRQDAQKIYVDDSGTFAICMAGVADLDYFDFLMAFRKEQFNLEKVLAEGKFPELAEMNLSRWGGRIPDTSNINGCLIATNLKKKPKLYTCWPLGRVEERYWTSIGSGSEYALDELRKKADEIPAFVSSKKGVDLALRCLDKASKDIYTGGIDIVVVTPTEIKEFGNVIKKNLERAKKQFTREIKAEL